MDDATATETTNETTQQGGPTAAGPERVLVPEGAEPKLPPLPGTSVHVSRATGRATVISDVDVTAGELSSALARYLPADVRLVEAVTNAGAVMLVFQGGRAPAGVEG